MHPVKVGVQILFVLRHLCPSSTLCPWLTLSRAVLFLQPLQDVIAPGNILTTDLHLLYQALLLRTVLLLCFR